MVNKTYIYIYILPAYLIISLIFVIGFLDITGKERKESCSFPVEGGMGGWLGLLARVGGDVNFNFNFIALNSAGKVKNRKCATEEHLGLVQTLNLICAKAIVSLLGTCKV